jgi:uncharacterized lipoprotein YbaY
MPRTVSGRIFLPRHLRWTAGTQLLVRLSDVSYEDGPAPLLAEAKIRTLRPTELAAGSVPFSLECPDPAPGRSYAVRVHLDFDGNGAVSRGDFVSTQRFPVAESDAAASPLRIRLERVE